MSKRILFITPYPKGEAPSQRFRFEQYFHLLKENDCDIETHSFLSEKTWNLLYHKSSFFSKTLGILQSFFQRFLLLFRLKKFDYIFIHREASMIGPPFFEWFIAKVLRRKYIYDFDDAIWLPNYSKQHEKLQRLKFYGKVKNIIRWADQVTVGNHFLKEFALKYNDNVSVIPTTIDLVNVHTLDCNHNSLPVNIGWTGTHTTLNYLEDLLPVLEELEKDYEFTFTVISNHPPNFYLKSLRFVQWNKETEIEDLAKIQIGLMPLEDNDWSKGKCGFKALQYMALGIPAVVSPIGVNTSIVEDGKNGYLCDNPTAWKNCLEKLIQSKELRMEIGKAGKITVRKHFSVEAQSNNFLKLFV